MYYYAIISCDHVQYTSYNVDGNQTYLVVIKPIFRYRKIKHPKFIMEFLIHVVVRAQFPWVLQQ